MRLIRDPFVLRTYMNRTLVDSLVHDEETRVLDQEDGY
jgi:hypothetical protein